MTDLVTELAARGRMLPPEERVRLLDLLLESLDETPNTEIERAWTAEITRRVVAHERGEGINVLVGADSPAPYGGVAYHDVKVWLRPA